MKLYKLKFDKAHFGENSLTTSEQNFQASRLFSALFLESMKFKREEEFLQLAQSDDFVLSDAFPYNNGEIFIPKPIIKLENKEKSENLAQIKENRELAKKTKKITYLNYEDLELYLNGELFEEYDELETDFSKKDVKTSVNIKDDGDPYNIAISNFENFSLYVIAQQSELFDELMTSLQFSGIGGKKSTGLGQFELEILDVPQDFKDKLTTNTNQKVLLLTTAMAKEEELKETLENANYLLVKNSGFAYSESSSQNLRKQDFYKFKAGSTFDKTFQGEIKDTRPLDFKHPVWNYAKALFLKI